MNAVTRSQAAVVRPRAASRRAAQVVCQAAPEQAASRRTFAAALFAAPILAAALPAAALILDDEDLECVPSPLRMSVGPDTRADGGEAVLASD